MAQASSPIDISSLLKGKLKLDSVRLGSQTDPKPVHLLNLNAVQQAPGSSFRVYEYGKPSEKVPRDEKIILVVGATGAGKTTFLNSLINFVFGVDFEDDFRIKLVTNETDEQNQAVSQTQFVNVYTIHHQEGFKVPYTLTIIDTPGFGDSLGLAIKRDYEIAEQLYEFFTSNIVDHIDAVGFVCPASLPRLTPTQKYIFDVILSLFGKDIGENIFMLITFCDIKRPKTLAAIEAADIPYKKYFKFNNSAVFDDGESDESDDDDDDDDDDEGIAVFWKIGMKSFRRFTEVLNETPRKTLTMTKAVMEERRMIEIYIHVMHHEISTGLLKLKQLKQEEALLQKYGNATREDLEEITYEKETEEDPEENINPSKDGYISYVARLFHYTLTKTALLYYGLFPFLKTSPLVISLRKTVERYEKAFGRPMSTKDVIAAIKKDFQDNQTQILFAIREIQNSLDRLHEIALRDNPLDSVDYIDILIQNEKMEAKKGWQENVEELQRIRACSLQVMEIGKDEFQPFNQFSDIMQEADITNISSLSSDAYQKAKEVFLAKAHEVSSCSIQ